MFRIHTDSSSATRLLFLALTLALIGGSLASAASAEPRPAEPHHLNVGSGLTGAGAPLALRGYDPVSFFVDDEPTLGEARWSVAHEGATYRFASKKNQIRFEKSPDRYLPQYGGFCAYGVSVGAKFDGDPRLWRIVDGKLYLNLNEDIQKAWSADVRGAIEKADAHWTAIRDADPTTLEPQG